MNEMRLFSTNNNKIQLTPEQISIEVAKVEKYKLFIRQPVGPTTFTQVQGDGSDLYVPENISELGALSGMPAEHAKRQVIISQRPNKSNQSGDKNVHHWQITWPNQERWTNPLMGWTSSADPMSTMKLYFSSSEKAVAFANRNGWDYEVLRPSSKSVRPVGYTHYKHNFLSKRTLAELQKDGMKNKIFENYEYGNSNWFMPLKYHGDGEVVQHGPSK